MQAAALPAPPATGADSAAACALTRPQAEANEDALPPRLLTNPDTLLAHGDTLADPTQMAAMPRVGDERTFGDDSLIAETRQRLLAGEAGDPVPTSLAADDGVTATLLACFLLAMAALTGARAFVVRMAKAFFRTSRDGSAPMSETPAEVRFQSLLVVEGCLLLAVLQHSVDFSTGRADPYAGADHWAMATYAAIFAAYIVGKHAVQAVANAVFFDTRANREWLRWALFIAAAEGAAMFPVTLLRVYFDLPVAAVMAALGAIVAAAKVLSLCKCKTIFFRSNGGFLQIILYFCALEIAPLLALCGILVANGNA